MNDEKPINMHAPAGATKLGSEQDELFANQIACAIAVLLEATVRPGQPDGMPLCNAAFVMMKALDHLLRGAGLDDAEARRAVYRDLAGVFDDAPEPVETDAAAQDVATEEGFAVQGPVKVWAEDDPSADLERTLVQVRLVAAANAMLIRLALRAGEADGIALIDATNIGYLTGAILLELAGVSPETRTELLERARWFYEGVQPFLVRPELDADAENAKTIEQLGWQVRQRLSPPPSAHGGGGRRRTEPSPRGGTEMPSREAYEKLARDRLVVGDLIAYDVPVITIQTKGRAYGRISRAVVEKGVALPELTLGQAKFVATTPGKGYVFLALWSDDNRYTEQHIAGCVRACVAAASRHGIPLIAMPILGGKREGPGLLHAMERGVEEAVDQLDAADRLVPEVVFVTDVQLA